MRSSKVIRIFQYRQGAPSDVDDLEGFVAIGMSRVVRLGLKLLIVLLICGCTGGTADSDPARIKVSTTKRSKCGAAERKLINELIESLANKNPMPKRARDLPVFSDGYDWAEDQRVFKVLKQLDEQDKECLFYCITEHLGDKHYCFTYGFNGEDHIETVGSMCHHAAAGQLASAFAGGPGARVPDLAFHSRTIGPDDDWEAWCGGHKNVPLYKQQIEMCEALIKRIVASNYIAKYVPEAEKAEYIAFIRGQIEKLDREKTPIFSPYGKMSWAVGGIYIDNPEMAKRIGAR